MVQELKKQFKLEEEELEKQKKQIEELKNEIGYKEIAKIPIEEYERRHNIIEFERNNKLHNTKFYLNNNENSLEKFLKIGQKKMS